MEIYAPIAHRLGMGKMRGELEDLAFSYLEPEAYQEIKKSVESRQKVRQELLDEVKELITQKLQEHDVPGTVDSRIKRIYSIHEKIKRQKIPIEQVYDLLAVRIITDTVKDCYAALGLIHNLWRPVPGRIKDFIAIPRPNMYQSLHTSVIGPHGQPSRFRYERWRCTVWLRKASPHTGNTRQASPRTIRTISGSFGCGIWWNGSRKCRILATF